MATAKTKARATPRFGREILDAIADVGETREFRFVLRRVKLVDGQLHQLRKLGTVKVKWDPAVQSFAVFDTKFLFAAQGESPQGALREYLDQWGKKVDWLTRHEAELGQSLQEELQQLRQLLSLTTPPAA